MVLSVNTLGSRDLVLEMRSEVEIVASDAAAAFAQAAQMSIEKVDEIRMAVIEACINAAEHSDSADSRIHLSLRLLGDDLPRKVEVSVGDHGVGIPAEILARGSGEQLRVTPRKRGWGLSIIRGLMDEVEIESGRDGTTVTMAKWL